MKTRYKIGKFNSPVIVAPGDEIRLTLTEKNLQKQTVTEKITTFMTITHWVMFYVVGVGFGGMFGGSNIGAKMSEIFAEPELIGEDEILMS